MFKSTYAALGLALFAGCASYPAPNSHLAASMAAVRGAETAGASQVPQAALHLKLAQEQLAQAETMMNADENERADAMAIRAYNDADLALALAREAQAARELESYASNHADVSRSSAPDESPPKWEGASAPDTTESNAPATKGR